MEPTRRTVSHARSWDDRPAPTTGESGAAHVPPELRDALTPEHIDDILLALQGGAVPDGGPPEPEADQQPELDELLKEGLYTGLLEATGLRAEPPAPETASETDQLPPEDDWFTLWSAEAPVAPRPALFVLAAATLFGSVILGAVAAVALFLILRVLL